MPGVGLTYRFTPMAQLFGSVYRAFALPLVGSVIGVDIPPTKAEKSLNIEWGMRGANRHLTYEVTARRSAILPVPRGCTGRIVTWRVLT